MSDKVYVLDTSMIRFFRYPDRSVRELAQQATLPLLQRWKLRGRDIDAVIFANSGWEKAEGQTCIRGEVALRGIGIEGMPIINVENACASGSTAVHVACHRILAGASDLVLVVGAERVSQSNPLLQMAWFLGGLDVGELPRTLHDMREWVAKEGLDRVPDRQAVPLRVAPGFTPGDQPSRMKRDAPDRGNARRQKAGRTESGQRAGRSRASAWLDTLWAALVLRVSYGPQTFRTLLAAAREGRKNGLGGGDRSPFMDVYAVAARYHMKKHGLTQRQLAAVASKNREQGRLNPLAQVQKPLSVDEVLADRLVSYPLTRAMCAPIGDGAAAALLCSGAYLSRRAAGSPRVRVRASILVSGTNRSMDGGEDLAVRAARRAYAEAGVGPADVSVAELHDATAFGEIHHCETLGFCGTGEGGPLAESGATALGGRIPVNTSGGLECRGHPIAASGIAQIHEIFEQLTVRAGWRQVEGARIGLAENGGGNIGFEEAALTVHILEREESHAG